MWLQLKHEHAWVNEETGVKLPYIFIALHRGKVKGLSQKELDYYAMLQASQLNQQNQMSMQNLQEVWSGKAGSYQQYAPNYNLNYLPNANSPAYVPVPSAAPKVQAAAEDEFAWIRRRVSEVSWKAN